MSNNNCSTIPKTCNYFNTCGCRYGSKCWFSHSVNVNSVNHALLQQLINLNGTLSKQQKAIIKMESSIEKLHVNHMKEMQQIKITFETHIDKSCKAIKDQQKQHLSSIKGWLNDEIKQMKQNQKKLQKTTQSQKDIIGSIKTSLETNNKHKCTLNNSLKQLNNKIIKVTKEMKHTLSIASDGINKSMESKMDDFLNKKIDKLTKETKKILNIACDDINNKILNGSKQPMKQLILKDASTGTEKWETKQETKMMDSLLGEVNNIEDIYAVSLIPNNYECKVLEIIEEEWNECDRFYTKAKVQCNGITSIMLIDDEYIAQKGNVWKNENVEKDGWMFSFYKKTHFDYSVIEIALADDSESDDSELDDNENEDKVIGNKAGVLT
eukprot:50365_1